MYVSPPIARLALLIVGITVATWLASPQREPAQATVSISTVTYSKLALWAKGNAGVDQLHRTVEQVVEELTNKREKDN